MTPQKLGELYIDQMRSDGQLEANDKPVLVICTTDLVAFGALKQLRSAGIRVPQDVMVMGVDGDEAGKYCNPTLTTLVLDPMVLGEKVVSRMLAKIDQQGEPAESYLDLSPAIADKVRRGDSTLLKG